MSSLQKQDRRFTKNRTSKRKNAYRPASHAEHFVIVCKREASNASLVACCSALRLWKGWAIKSTKLAIHFWIFNCICHSSFELATCFHGLNWFCVCVAKISSKQLHHPHLICHWRGSHSSCALLRDPIPSKVSRAALNPYPWFPPFASARNTKGCCLVWISRQGQAPRADTIPMEKLIFPLPAENSRAPNSLGLVL